MSNKVAILQAIIRAWSERQDVDAVLAHLSEDVVWHYSAVTAAPAVGHAGARQFLEAFRTRVRNPRWRIFAVAENATSLFLEGADVYDTADGHEVVIPYMGVLDFDGDQIIGWRDYFDRGTADRSAKGEALPAHAQALAARAALEGMGR